MTLADVLRLVAVPVLGWAAYRDVKVRRVPTRTWYPLVALGVVLLAVEAWQVYAGGGGGSGATLPYGRWLFSVRLAVSLGVVAPFAYLVWRLGGFGGADAKALMALAVLFPTYPTYVVDALSGGVLVFPTQQSRLGVFSLTILTNTVLLGATYPALLTLRNLLARDLSTVLVFGRPVATESLPERHGSLLETPDGYTRSGLDLDALRMYLRWRGCTLAELRADPDRFRDPRSVPVERTQPGDGAVATDGGSLDDGGGPDDTDGQVDDGGGPDDAGGQVDGGAAVTGADDRDDAEAAVPGPERLPNGVAPGDEWGAAAFLEDLGWGAYGTSPGDLRAGLEVVAERERVWYSPGIPFIVPMFVGLVVAVGYGDLLAVVLRWLGLA